MAKISARGAHEVGRWTTTRNVEGVGRVEYLWVLCSDGRLLVRTARIEGEAVPSTYNVRGKIARKGEAERVAWVANYLAARYDDVVMA